LRQGPYGAGAVNDRVERMLAGEGGVERGVWYACRPVMVVRNDYGLKLFNGDVGLILPADPAHEQATLPAPATQAALHGGSGRSIGQGDGVWRAWFPGPGGDFRSFPTARLPAHETVFAMTVHKSQGSEFDDVLLILPDRPSPVLTRELVYTAVTRARRSVTVCGCADVFKTAVARRVERSSGLRDALWGA
jgi:exodeoxyribonuclease V alpha subunit